MPCKLCTERGKTWEGSDPRCAFESGTFSGDNWNCATMGGLRSIASRSEWDTLLGWNHRDDMCCASIGVLTIPENDTVNGYLVMTWYKNRGKTGDALIMCNGEREELTEEKALAIIDAYKKEENK